MKKNVIVACMVLALSLTLVSCGSEQNNAGTDQPVGERSFIPETEKPSRNDMSTNGSFDNVTREQESKEPLQSGSSQANDKSKVTKESVVTKEPVKAVEATTKPSVKPTTKPSTKPTVTPTIKPTTKPMAKPTTKPTTKPTLKPTTTPGSSSEKDTSAYIAEVLNIINRERAAEGLSPLTTNASLKKAAAKRAEETVTLFSHTRPDGTSGSSVMKEYDITYRAWGENIAYGQSTSEEVMNTWMNSSGHRANILSSKFGKVGIGCYAKNGVLYWTQVFMN